MTYQEYQEQRAYEARMRKRKKQRRRRQLTRLVVKATLYSMMTSLVIAFIFCGFYIKNHSFDALVIEASSLAEDLVVGENGYTIILDAGHGGKDQGTSYKTLIEKDVNLEVVSKLSFLLESKGFNVIQTRDKDVFVELPDRAAISNNNNADLFVSIHCNYNEDSTSISGLECHYYSDNSTGQEVADSIINSLNNRTSIETRGTIKSDFHVLRNTSAPAVLIELGYFSNETDREHLTDDKYINLLCEALAQAIADSLPEETL